MKPETKTRTIKLNKKDLLSLNSIRLSFIAKIEEEREVLWDIEESHKDIPKDSKNRVSELANYFERVDNQREHLDGLQSLYSKLYTNPSHNLLNNIK